MREDERAIGLGDERLRPAPLTVVAKHPRATVVGQHHLEEPAQAIKDILLELVTGLPGSTIAAG